MSQGVSSVMPELPEEARCAGCGYCLRGSVVPQCPECGRSFDAEALLKSLAPKRRRPLTSADLRRIASPGWTEYFAVGGAVIWSGWILGDLDFNEWNSSLPFALLPILGIFLMMLIDILAIKTIFLTREVPALLRDWHFRQRISLAGTLIVLTSLYWSPWPPDARFWCSRYALDRLAQQVLTTGNTPPDEWVGFYHARYVSRIENGMNFRLGNWNDCHGLEYIVPGHQPARAVQYRHLGGNWYYWRP